MLQRRSASDLKYYFARDFEPIGITVHAPAVIVARKDLPANNLREFIAYMKDNGERVKMAHGGIGLSSHMACMLFASAAGVKPTFVAYRGVNLAINDLLGGHVDFYCEQAVSVAEQIAAGTLKAYAVSSAERLAVLPAVPTARESGLNYQMTIWVVCSRRREHLQMSSRRWPAHSTAPSTTQTLGSGLPSSAVRFRQPKNACRPRSHPLSRKRLPIGRRSSLWRRAAETGLQSRKQACADVRRDF